MSPDISTAEEYRERSGFVVGGWAGYGVMNVSTDNSTRNSNGTFALGLRGGYALSSRVILGLELNGWTLKAYDVNDPSKGESVSNISIFMDYFPFKEIPIYVAGGGGRISYSNNSPNVNGRDKGGSWFLGSGYEYNLSKKLMLVPQLRYSRGNFTGGNFDVFEIALGLNWYSGNQ